MNKKVFIKRRPGREIVPTTNEAGGSAYLLSDKEVLAQLVMTGTFNNTYYTNAQDQQTKLASLLPKLDSEFIGKCAIHGRQNGLMKDMPAYLVAFLATRNDGVLEKVFPIVIDNFKMLSNFCQVIRSGVTGRKSFGRRPRRLIRAWLNAQDPVSLWSHCIGGDPSFVDIVKMVHPNFDSPTAKNVVAYILDKEYVTRMLPEEIRTYERFKAGESSSVEGIPFLRLTSLPLSIANWQALIPNMGYQALRINLNTLVRQGALKNDETRRQVVRRLKDAQAIKRTKTMPYQLLAAFKNFDATAVEGGVAIQNALQDAMEIATENVPTFVGKKVAICCDVSGSMKDPLTGGRAGATTKVQCVDAAALMSACVLRYNAEATIVPFDTRVHACNLNSRDSVMTNATLLAKYGGGGTDCNIALQHLVDKGCKQDVVIFVSDNQSWAHAGSLVTIWNQYRKINTRAKLVLIDIQPFSSTPAFTRQDILNIGGFSDNIWEVIESFVNDGISLIKTIESIAL